MKNILKKLHIVSNEPPEEPDGSPPPPPRGASRSPSQPFTNLSSWLGSVTSRHATSSASPPTPSFGPGEMARKELEAEAEPGKALGTDAEEEEELQIRLALELSAKEDPEAVQIEAVKQISLGSCSPDNTPAEVLAYRYWNYNVLSYDDKVLDGFYDLYGIVAESSLVKMPSLTNLQATPVSDNIPWEAVLVNMTNDADLLKLEQKALVMALELKRQSIGLLDLVRRLAVLVSDYMGGMVSDPDSMSLSWRKLNNYLRASLGTMILPLGRITIGLARHRALLFKVLADSVGIPCQLMKGQQYTGTEDGALNIVKFSDGREYIVDLMADPGTLIPSDSAGLGKDFEETFFHVNPFLESGNNSHITSNNNSVLSTVGCFPDKPTGKESMTSSLTALDSAGVDYGEPQTLENQQSSQELCIEGRDVHSDGVSLGPGQAIRSNQPYILARSPSWTEGINSPAVRRMKVKDVSRYMIEAAKENPQLAQKLHDVLLESGVVAPPDLFAEIYTEHQDPLAADVDPSEDGDEMKRKNNEPKNKAQDEALHCSFLPPLPRQNLQGKAVPSRPQPEPLRPIEVLVQRSLAYAETANVPCLSQSETSAAQLQEAPFQFMRNMPVAAAAATAAVVASSMVVAAAKSNSDIKMEVPVAAAATATAAAVATAAVSMQYEHSDNYALSQGVSGPCHNLAVMENEKDAIDGARVGSNHLHDGGFRQESEANAHQEMDRLSDKSTGNESVRSDIALDDVAEWEIRWEDIILGERIGLGSFGEVYRGDLHGTEVAVKKFLHQDISGDALEEFISEVRIMKRLRHPNVVLFMGAVTRVPNLCIVTEFLPRGSLFRLIHRPNNQLDERRRLRMALDVARGMNYLHNCTPVIVHRDLKSPNLLVDKNWVVKVCDFGLSRIKHSTFLSSRSAAGTAEWMAPELLRNEPSDEKCDVFSFGVILWELCTLQQPWRGMNPMQVVGAVGFQQRRLDIPDNVDPAIADIITKCWQTDPKMRPSFAEIMGYLKPLQKSLMASTQMTRQRTTAAGSAEHDIL